MIENESKREPEDFPLFFDMQASPGVVPSCRDANVVLKILVVDDEPTVLRLTKTILEIGGYEAITASNAEDALKICHEMGGTLSLVISDVSMPGMNGREFAKCVANLPQPVPVILMSGYSPDSPIVDGLKDGRIDSVRFLPKPFDHRKLLELVSATINPQ